MFGTAPCANCECAFDRISPASARSPLLTTYSSLVVRLAGGSSVTAGTLSSGSPLRGRRWSRLGNYDDDRQRWTARFGHGFGTWTRVVISRGSDQLRRMGPVSIFWFFSEQLRIASGQSDEYCGRKNGDHGFHLFSLSNDHFGGEPESCRRIHFSDIAAPQKAGTFRGNVQFQEFERLLRFPFYPQTWTHCIDSLKSISLFFQ